MIGGSDTDVDGVFSWESGNAITFENWDSGEPSNVTNQPDCMLMRSNWKWHDWGCYSQFQSICEREPTDTGNDLIVCFS